MSKVPTLLHAMEHHAKDKREVILAIALVYTTVLAPKGWGIKNLRGGPSSWMIYDENNTDRQFHFRNGGKGAIRVQNHYNRSMATWEKVFKTRMDVLNWAVKVT
jgi:hypothetical protein